MRGIPRSRRDEGGGERDGRLLVRTTAAPVDGAANEAVRRLLAAHFGVSRRQVILVTGDRSRDKVFRVER